MIIKRTIGGIEHSFELTTQEMITAFCEQQNIFYREDIESFKEQYLEWNENATEEKIDENMDDIVEKYADIESEHDWWQSAESAIDWVLREV